jgi:hypothetical protein
MKNFNLMWSSETTIKTGQDLQSRKSRGIILNIIKKEEK